MQSKNPPEIIEHLKGPDELLPAEDLFTWKADVPVKLRRDDKNTPPVSVVTLFRRVVENNLDKIAMVDTYDDVHETYTYRRYNDCVLHVAKAFIKLGLKRYHGVGILGFNSPHWSISHLACIFAGGLSAGIYTTNSAEACAYIASNAKCNILVVENDFQLQKILKVSSDLPELKAIIQYRGSVKDGGHNVYSWDDIMNMDVDDFSDELDSRIKCLAPNKCCSLIYTSGTTGMPKGTMISHDNITWTLQTFINYVYEGQTFPPDTVVSYLPLSHVAAMLVDIYWTLISGGGTTYFARPDALKGSLVKSLREAHPTAFFGVPRVWEKFVEAMIGSGNQVNHKQSLEAAAGQGEPNHLDQQDLSSKLGLDRCRLMLVGSAPSKRDVMDYLWACGVKVLDVYGLSECAGPHLVNNLSNFKMDTVGKTIPGFRTKFNDSNDEGGEICLDGRHVFMGYLNNEMMTRESFDEDCWFRTGDLGKQDEEGFITITGRIKELIITAGGENIPPTQIENRVLKELPCLSQCMLIGEKKKFLSMLLTFKTEVDETNGRPKDNLDNCALEWCRKIGSNATKVSEILSSKDPLIMKAIQNGIDKANEKAISRAQCIQKWMILPRDFSTFGGELGPTMKMKRNEICKIYQNEIESFY